MGSIFVNDGDVVKQSTEVYVNDGGIMKNVSEIYVNDGGIMKQSFSSGVSPVLWNKAESLTSEFGSNFTQVLGTTGYGTGVFNNAWDFTSASPSIIGQDFTYPDQFTIEFWMYPKTSHINQVFCNGYLPTLPAGFITIRQYDGDFDVYMGLNSRHLYSGVLASLIGTWVHVAVTYDGGSTTDSHKSYINGVLLTPSGGSHTAISKPFTPKIYLGTGYNGGSYANTKVDNIKIFDFVKTDFSDRWYDDGIPIIFNQYLRISVTNDGSAGNHYVYYNFTQRLSYVVQSGDKVILTIYGETSSSELYQGGIDIYFTDGTAARNLGMVETTTGLARPLHALEIDRDAYQTWFTYTIPFTASTYGKTIDKILIVEEENTPSMTNSFRINECRILNSSNVEQKNALDYLSTPNIINGPSLVTTSSVTFV